MRRDMSSWIKERNKLMKRYLRYHRFIKLFLHTKNRLSFRTSGSFCKVKLVLSGHSGMRIEAPGSRYPLDPVVLRHVKLNRSALLADSIIFPWRSHGRYVFKKLYVCICSIALPFRTCSPNFSNAHYNTLNSSCHYTYSIISADRLWSHSIIPGAGFEPASS